MMIDELGSSDRQGRSNPRGGGNRANRRPRTAWRDRAKTPGGRQDKNGLLRADGRDGNRIRVVIHPLLKRGQAIDVTETLVRAVAQELSRLGHENDVLNELEAEVLLQEALRSLRVTPNGGETPPRGRLGDDR